MKTNPSTLLPSFDQINTVHVIGICGTLMGAFATYLKRSGIQVSGSDQDFYPPMSDVLKDAEIELFSGYRPENLTLSGRKPDLVIIGNVIRADNPEAKAAIDAGYPFCSLPEAMKSFLLKQTTNLVVAGTHGKTTTSSILAHVLSEAGVHPNYFIGGISRDLPFSFHLSRVEKGKYFVLEGDEYDTAFWDKVPKFFHYLPDHVILTSIEYDHADIYPDLESLKSAFEGLIDRIRPNGSIIACFDYPVVRELVMRSKVPVTSYGSEPSVHVEFAPVNIEVEREYTKFSVAQNEKVVDQLLIRSAGVHNVLNALSVWIQCRNLGVDPQKVRGALESFQGVRRRQEIRGVFNDVVVIDDFAHHPTAVRETLKALKSRFSKNRLIAVFEPRSATSRRKVFQTEYLKSFQEADMILIGAPYDQSRIPEEDHFSSQQLVDDLNQSGKNAQLLGEVDTGVQELVDSSKPGDVIAVLSNGAFGGLLEKLTQHLANREKAR